MKKVLMFLMVCASTTIIGSLAQAQTNADTLGGDPAFRFQESRPEMVKGNGGSQALSDDGRADFYYDLKDRTASGMVIIGDDAGDEFGRSLATGDLNGDGYDDLIVGSDNNAGISKDLPRAGAVFIFYGNSDYNGDTLFASEADAIIYGVDEYDVFGQAIECGDINNDGLADIVVGACWGYGLNNSTPFTGEVYIIFGKTTMLTTMSASAADVIIYGSTNSYGNSANQLGSALTIGDVNGDNINDVIINAPGEDNSITGVNDCGAYYVKYGSSVWSNVINLTSNYDVKAFGEAADDDLLWQDGIRYRALNCMTTGDINCDGYDDLLLGFPGGDGLQNNVQEAGEIRIVYGSSTLPRDIDLSTGTDVILYGTDVEDYLCLSKAIDVNNNGCKDILIGIPNADGRTNAMFDAGELWIIYNSTNLPNSIMESQVDIVIYGRNYWDGLGRSVFAGDQMNNGTNSLMIGSHRAYGPDDSRNICGEIVFFNRTDLLSDVVDLYLETSDAIIYGSEIGDYLGSREIRLSNFDNDNILEIIAAAEYADYDGKENVGKVFIMQGSSFFKEDSDNDGIVDEIDNCPGKLNANQIDTDGDGIGDICDDICGDVNSSGGNYSIDIGDLVFMISYMFQHGEAPSYNDALDIDGCDGENIADLTYLINYMFKGGPSPNCAVSPCLETIEGMVKLDHVDGLYDAGSIKTGEKISFHIRLTNNDQSHLGITNGFRVYSPDNNVTWASTTIDVSTINPLYNDYFDLGNYYSPINTDGIGSDTVGYSGVGIQGGGLPANFDNVAYRIDIGPIDPIHHGKTIILDSAFYPPVNEWKWGLSDVTPKWEGPYTFTIVDPAQKNLEVVVNKPLEGEVWTIGEEQNIFWTITGNGGLAENIDIYLSRDAGVSWEENPIASFNSPIVNNFNWTVTGPEPITYCMIKVVASNSEGTAEGKSKLFTIISAPPVVKLDTPTADDVWSVGDTKRISWELSGGEVDNIEIYIARIFGSPAPLPVFESILTQTLSVTATSFDWQVTEPAEEWLSKAQIKIIVTGPGGVSFDISEEFHIRPKANYGTTVIVHGYTLLPGDGSSLDLGNSWPMAMGNAIIERFGSGVLYIASDGNTSLVEEDRRDIVGNGERVIVFDWIAESDREQVGYLEAAADALAAILMEQHILGNQGKWNLNQLHFIGHSRGALVCSETIQRLGLYANELGDSEIDNNIHLTTLDAHPWEDVNNDCVGEAKGDADDYKINNGILARTGEDDTFMPQSVVCWENVGFADNYHQGKCKDSHASPNGLHSYIGLNDNSHANVNLYDGSDGEEDIWTGGTDGFNHSAVHAWYYGTVLRSFTTTDNGVTGFLGKINIDRTVYYPNNEDFTMGFNNGKNFKEYTLTNYAIPEFNRVSIYRDNNLWNGKIFNGNLSYIPGSNEDIPGWSFHGGASGNGTLWGVERYIEADGSKGACLSMYEDGNYLIHNKQYIPKSATDLAFNFRLPSHYGEYSVNVPSGALKVYINEYLIGEIPLIAHKDKFGPESKVIDITNMDFAGTTARIKFILTGEAYINIDDIRWHINDKETLLQVHVGCPVDIELTSPIGQFLSRDSIDIASATYDRYIVSPGDTGATISIPNPLDGVYQVNVIPHPNTAPDAVYSVYSTFGQNVITFADHEPISSIPPNGFLYSTLDTGSIFGTISSDSVGLLGITVGLYDSTGEFVSSMTTNYSGNYQFSSLDNGIYTVSIVTPLGYQAESESQEIQVRGLPHEVNFVLTKLDIPLAQRGRGYWMHQVNTLLSGRGNPHETMDDMCDYMELVRTHFNSHGLNPINVFEVALTEDCNQRLEALRTTISPIARANMNEKARAHLTALLLNMVSGKIAQWQPISEDSLTVSQAITYCNILITDDNLENDEMAKNIAEMINEGKEVPTGWIDPLTPDIAYRQGMINSLPDNYSLGQNYPNPFNPTTEISFSLASSSDAKLEVYNLLGQVVSTIVDSKLEAGTYSYRWNGSAFASGVYLYKLTAGNFTETKKMMLIK